jgi:OOP family OmpA-OmpF porin
LKISAGHNFDKNYGLEAGYAYFGNVKETSAGISTSLKPSAVYIAMTGSYLVAPQLSVLAKVGISQNHITSELRSSTASADDKQNKTTGLFGVGAAYQFSKQVFGVVEYEYFGKALDQDGVSLKLSMLSFGVRYAF